MNQGNREEDGNLHETFSFYSLEFLTRVEVDAQSVAVKRNQLEKELNEHKLQERLFVKVLESLDAITVTDADGTIVLVNDAFTRFTGYRQDEVIGKTPRILKSGRQSEMFYQVMWQTLLEHGHWEGEIWNKRKNGEVYPEWLRITVMKDETGRATHYVAHFLDLTNIRQAESQIQLLEYFDPLTGLSNRRGFSRLMKSKEPAIRDPDAYFLVLVDVDQFNKINDSLGHVLGDRLLQALARRLLTMADGASFVARLGGDEFGLLHVPVLIEGNLRDMATELAETVRTALTTPYDIDEQTIYVSVSIGVCAFRQDESDWEEMMKGADLAMYQAKCKGGNRVECFNPAMLIQAEREYLLISDLRKAVEEGQLPLYIQGQFDRESRLVGAEVLSRWRWEGEWVSPTEFVALAERTNLIIELDLQTIRRALEELAKWNEKEIMLPSLSINISALHLRQAEFATSIQRMIEKSRVNPSWVALEITENSLLDGSTNVSKNLDGLAEMGVRISLDDFGTGYSSLSNITAFPITELKIDRTFVQDLTESLRLQAITGAVIELGRRLDLNVVAEGIENADQFGLLRDAGCPIFQGFYFMRPEPIEVFAQRLGKTRFSFGGH